jgi:DNA-binding transcriptional regulator YdaS (Cro superfamily)
VTLNYSIDAAAAIVGSQNKLAELLGIPGPNLSQIRTGKRPCPIGVRARIAQIAGHDTTRAILEGLADKLDPADEFEGQALLQLNAVINAFPEGDEQEKSPVNPKINRASSAWRKRRDSNPR